MSFKIVFDPNKHTYDKANGVFKMSEKDVQFATEYIISNPRTGGEEKFSFSHSTGPEFDPKTKWVYHGDKGHKLEVCNDPILTRISAQNYIKAKTRGI